MKTLECVSQIHVNDLSDLFGIFRPSRLDYIISPRCRCTLGQSHCADVHRTSCSGNVILSSAIEPKFARKSTLISKDSNL